MKRLKRKNGYTMVELLIAVLLTAIVAAAGFEFYVNMHNSTMTQEEISDMQQRARASLQEISKTLRMAGYKVGTHMPFRVATDSLFVFYQGANPVDTVAYYLDYYTDAELAASPWLPSGASIARLMKQENSGVPGVFADFITDFNVRVIDSANIMVYVEVQTSKSDEDWGVNDGFRTRGWTERVTLRNILIS